MYRTAPVTNNCGVNFMSRIKDTKSIRILHFLVAAGLILTIALAVKGYGYINNSFNTQADTSARDNLEDFSTYISDTLTQKLTGYYDVLLTIASAVDNIESDDARYDYIKEASLKLTSTSFGMTDSDGYLTIMNSDIYEDVSNSDFYIQTMKGMSHIGLHTFTVNGVSKRYIMYCVPVSSYNADRPDSLICQLVDPEDLLTGININPHAFQIMLCESDNSVIAGSEFDEDNNTKPLYQLVNNVISQSDFTPINSIGDKAFTQYNNGTDTQYIMKTTDIYRNWVVYISINRSLFEINTAQYVTSMLIFTILIFTAIAIELIVLFQPAIINISRKRVRETQNLFIANMSHELRTPLNTIIGISEILSRSELTEGQAREVFYITDAGKNLLSMINDVLDYSKLRSERFELVTEEYSLESLIYDITTVATIRLDEKPVEFMIYISSYVPGYVIGDMARVRQIINNIISNAVKYTQTGSITLIIDCERTDTGHSGSIRLIFKIKDTGIGIKKENIPSIFESYTRFDSKINKNIEGTGLGLGIARQFAILMDGDITVESEYGKGSEFTICITQSVDNISNTEPLLPEYNNESGDGILILEKSPLMQAYYTSCLDDLMVNYRITDDNYEFSSLMSEGAFNYILADSNTIQMIQEEMDDTDMNLISLIHNSAETIHVRDTLLIPLFPLQIRSYLTGRKQFLKRNNTWNSLIIYPMPEKNILITDDNSMNLQVALGIMEPYKMNIDLAESGEKAIEMCALKQYDLIFMDYMMPEIDGETAMNEIRRLYPSYKATPIIALTANAATGARQMFIDMGFDDFIPKPLETVPLHELLYKWLKPENTSEAVELTKETPVLDEKYNESTCINFKEGLARIGSMPIYLNTLRNFCDTIPKKTESIKKSFPDDMQTFIIEVHGLKGIAAIISANELTNQSFELEMMGKSENIDSIQLLLPDFFKYMQKVKLCAENFIEEHA